MDARRDKLGEQIDKILHLAPPPLETEPKKDESLKDQPLQDESQKDVPIDEDPTP